MKITDILNLANFPTNYVVLDFETYFDDDYSLTKMSEWEYVTDSRFEVMGLGYKVFWSHGKESRTEFAFLSQVKYTLGTLTSLFGNDLFWSNVTVVCHNCDFDILILQQKYGIFPKFTIDVKHLAAHQDSMRSHKLRDLATQHGLGTKGNTTDFKGLCPLNMNPEQIQGLVEYSKNDVEIEAGLFKALLPRLSYPEIELWFANHSTNLYVRPTIEFDFGLAKHLYFAIEKERNEIITATGFSEAAIRGTKSIVTLFEKIMPANDMPWKQGKNKMIPALAKNDDGCKMLLAHSDPRVRGLMEARLAAKSWPTHTKRLLTMAGMAKAAGGRLPVPSNYYASHTGRSGGGKKINLFNLGGAGRAGSGTHPLIQKMRNTLVAPTGCAFGISDSAQIEARILAWIAGCDTLRDGFARGEDIYSEFATTLFGEKVWKPSKYEELTDEQYKLLTIRRGFGKDTILGCLAKGTPILTNNGFKSIEQVSLYDKVWDGTDYVKHDGVIYQGEKPCTRVRDVWMTPEHEVLNSEGWITAGELSTHSQKSEKYMVGLPLSKSFMENMVGLSPSNVVAPAVDYLLLQETALFVNFPHAVMCALKRHPGKLRALAQLLRNRISPDCLVEFIQSLAVVGENRIRDMVDEVLAYGPTGSRIEWHFLNTWRHFQDTIIQNLKSTELEMIGDMSLVICDSQPEQSKCGTLVSIEQTGEEQPKFVKIVTQILSDGKQVKDIVQNIVAEWHPTYDILNAGPCKRFQAGNMLVSNCGYGLGSSTFYDKCLENRALRPLFDSGQYDLFFVTNLINTYRRTYPEIPMFWKTVENMFKCVAKFPDHHVNYGEKELQLDKDLLTMWNDNGTVNIQLPSGRVLFYPDARLMKTGDLSYKYSGLWGGALCVSGYTPVLTDRGWIRLDSVQNGDLIWDGSDFVSHQGLINKGTQEVVGLNGIDVTPDHKVLTDKGWVNADKTHGLNWENVWVPDCYQLSWLQREELDVDSSVRLWENIRDTREGLDPEKGFSALLTMFSPLKGEEQDTRDGETPSLCDMEVYEQPLPPTNPSVMEELRGQRNMCLQRMGQQLSEFLERCKSWIFSRVGFRQNRQQQRLQQRQLQMDYEKNELSEQAKQYRFKYTRYGEETQCAKIDPILQTPPRTSFAIVYDLLNCGPFNRFTVMDSQGEPRLVHNCENIVQAVARDFLVHWIRIIEEAGIKVVHHVYDEIITVLPEDEIEAKGNLYVVDAIMKTAPAWGEGVPLEVESKISKVYTK